jgi:hypothetical protein
MQSEKFQELIDKSTENCENVQNDKIKSINLTQTSSKSSHPIIFNTLTK